MSLAKKSSLELGDVLQSSSKNIAKTDKPLDMTSWETAFHENSILANFNADDLKLIHNCLSLYCSYSLARSCRRLYCLWVNERKSTKAVEIVSDENFWKNRKTIFKRNISSDARDPNNKKDEDSAKLVRFNGARDISLPFYELLDDLEKLGNIFVNLCYLGISISIENTTFASLVTVLNTYTRQLTTLKLHLNFYSNFAMTIQHSLHNNFWDKLAQLKLPSLKHLTIIQENDYLFGNNNIISPPILQQLVSFSFYLQKDYYSIHPNLLFQTYYQLIVDSPYGAHLAPGVGARFGLSQNWTRISGFVPLQPELLLYMTYLDVAIDWFCYRHKANETKKIFISCLPQMLHLQSFKLEIRGMNTIATDIPSCFTAFASLPHLQELSIDFCQISEFGKRGAWPPASLPVFPAVRILSLSYFTSEHTDIVEQFQLTRCFPKLCKLKVHFEINSCSACFFRHGTNISLIKRCQACGSELTRGMLKLESMQQPEKEKALFPKVVLEVKFTFNYNIVFDSLANLQEGIYYHV